MNDVSPRTPPEQALISVIIDYHDSGNPVRPEFFADLHELPSILERIGRDPFGHQAFPTEGPIVMHFALFHGDRDFFIPGTRLLELIHGIRQRRLHLCALVRNIPRCDGCGEFDAHLPFMTCRFCRGYQVYHHGRCCGSRPDRTQSRQRRRLAQSLAEPAPEIIDVDIEGVPGRAAG